MIESHIRFRNKNSFHSRNLDKLFFQWVRTYLKDLSPESAITLRDGHTSSADLIQDLTGRTPTALDTLPRAVPVLGQQGQIRAGLAAVGIGAAGAILLVQWTDKAALVDTLPPAEIRSTLSTLLAVMTEHWTQALVDTRGDSKLQVLFPATAA